MTAHRGAPRLRRETLNSYRIDGGSVLVLREGAGWFLETTEGASASPADGAHWLVRNRLFSEPFPTRRAALRAYEAAAAVDPPPPGRFPAKIKLTPMNDGSYAGPGDVIVTRKRLPVGPRSGPGPQVWHVSSRRGGWGAFAFSLSMVRETIRREGGYE